MRALFGTDGIRGPADEFPLDNPTMFALGEALATFLAERTSSPRIVIGMDTRESGPRIARAISAGIALAGGTTDLLGVIPTPAVAVLCEESAAAAGISISASHNPWKDNGVKIFGANGMKLADTIEKHLEDDLLARRTDSVVVYSSSAAPSASWMLRYDDFLARAVEPSCLQGKKVVLDVANGAAFRIAPSVFRRLGAEVVVMNDTPDGRNINENCGALHPEQLAKTVVDVRADFGVAFDGDADRAIFVDDKGHVRDGDQILCLWARDWKRRGLLRGDLLVTTVMSNFGFERQLAHEGIRLIRANVGDKYVLEEMLRSGAVLGGEQSGHVIDLTAHTTGDGLHTALIAAELIAREGRSLSELETFEPVPQLLLNLRIPRKPPIQTLERTTRAIADAESVLTGRGRVLVRYSGTENLVRVMVEGDDQSQIQALAESLVAVLRDEIG